MTHDMTYKLNGILAVILLSLATQQVKAQDSAPATPANPVIKIGGNVYGGGNEGDTEGNTKVTIRSCEIHGNVFGGARMADVTGRAFVHIDGAGSAGGEIKIKNVYGGNDIAGTVGKNVDPSLITTAALPSELTEVGTTPGKNDINDSWVAFVRTSKMATEDKNNRIVIGTIFGGGNGDYNYYNPGDKTGTDGENQVITATNYEIRDKETGNLIAESAEAFTKPTLTKTYLELLGGCLAHVYGGGNNVTVTKNTTLCINNTSLGLEKVIDPNNMRGSLTDLAQYMDKSTFQGDYSSLDFTFARIFGGNNKAAMSIMPVWNIQRGRIRDLYSGGNEGNMTSPYGLLMDIDPLGTVEEKEAGLYIVNVYGGCRRADVDPIDPATGDTPNTIQLPIDDPRYNSYKFPANLSARTIVRGGHIINVYGGNDISGHVFGGDAVGIYSTVFGDVYGAGNGSYSYTDNPALGALDNYRDFYYNPADVRLKEREYNNPTFEYSSTDADVQSVEALNIFRPNAEQISIKLFGSKQNPTYIMGAVYLGGNSATLKRKKGLADNEDPLVELKIGSHVYVDKMYLGNNGENMVTEDILHRYAAYQNTATGATVDSGTDDTKFSKMDLTNKDIFAKYMEGCAMSLKPRVVFDLIANNDQEEYDDYSSYFGSFYCGGNRGSMTWPGTNTIEFNRKVIIFDKFVGGCNNANIAKTKYNAEYLGGMIGSVAEQAPGGMEDENGNIKDCMIFNLRGLKIKPMRWKDRTNPHLGLEWNTICYTDGHNSQVDPTDINRTIHRNDAGDQHEFDRRLLGGNIYGGCYESGHMNGNVVINLIDDVIDLTGEHAVFDIVDPASHNPILYENDEYTITKRNSGVILDEQGMDPLGVALNVFGGGYGKDSEVWGSTTVNLRAGHTFQIYGGGQLGPIGKSLEANGQTTDFDGSEYVFNGKHYKYDARYSTYVNMEDDDHYAGSATADIPEIQFIYGGSFEAPIMGNTHVYLGNGRIFNSFAGSCNADILGHTETYVGQSINRDGSATDGQIIQSFPYVIDHIYGGNDLGGKILGEIRAEQHPAATDALKALTDCNFKERVGTTNGQNLTKVYGYDASSNPNPGVLKASAYIEYSAGHVLNIFGGAYGDYDYKAEKYREYCNEDGSNKPGFSKPRLGNAFINFNPRSNTSNSVAQLFGAGQGQHYVIDRDVMQERSYTLIDIPQDLQQFKNLAVFGAGSYCGLGMDETLVNKTEAEIAELTAEQKTAYYASLDGKSAVIDLARGQIKNVYGGSYNEGVTRRTVVNVPQGSTIVMTKQTDNEGNNIANTGCIFGGAYGEDVSYPCDVYESHVNYSSNDATVQGGIFGGNNNARRTLFANVDINSTVYSNKAAGYQGYVYGAGFGPETWAHYTNVNLNNNAVVYKLYGGGSAGLVLNEPSLNAWKNERIAASQEFDLTLGTGYTGEGYTEKYDLNPLAPWSELANGIEAGTVRDRGNGKEKYNTNVHINAGATVTGYAYGGGYGPQAVVSGDTYIDLLGGRVEKDIYAAGESGPVMCKFEAAETEFRACTNAFVKGGQVRNVYGGGWKGDVGYHGAGTLAVANDDVDGLTNVIIGTLNGTCLSNGIPVVERNAYGGGEGGAIYGTAHVSVNNGYIGYRFNGSDPMTTTFNAADYVEELHDMGNKDPEKRINGLARSGNVFGGGYVANSYTENAYVYMYNGQVRGSVYGGGEIGPVGRGTVKDVTGAPIVNANAKIFKPGQTHVYVYGGKVNRNVFGGGRGYDNWGGDGTELYKDQPEIIALMDLESKGFVFGETDVHIYGGEIGTKENVELGYGNVFGGGDIGFVYSGHGKKIGSHPEIIETEATGANVNKNGLPKDGGGYFYKYYNDDYTPAVSDAAAIAQGMTVDCSVDVAPYCKVKAGQTITFDKLKTDANGNFVLDANGYPTKLSGQTITFGAGQDAGEYVPNEYLNLLRNKTADGAQWEKLDLSGVIIHNAVFAGGNVSTGSDQIFVNTSTVYGNATAALRDVYHRDLITVGSEHIGGLYGDGNLTFVDGFRELHISNYGTDYYGMETTIDKEKYEKLTDRERAYFQRKYTANSAHTYDYYVCKESHEFTAGNVTTYYIKGQKVAKSNWATFSSGFGDAEKAKWEAGSKVYNANAEIEDDEWILMDDSEQQNWTLYGVCTIYAGRLLNTIQRADYVGIWGSRLVLQGARDRVPEVANFTEYTINRVDEVSLNKMVTQNSGDSGDDASHGNYFGIYSIVNYLGNLTSDVKFTDIRTTSVGENSPNKADGKTYYAWKESKKNDRYRNNATSHNRVALASGVFLELINEPTTSSSDKNWGYITGVVELDLIDVKPGLGGGYVYAKNEHGQATLNDSWSKVTLSPYNVHGVTHRRYTYNTTLGQLETSGNFVHNTKQIIDDCYPIHNLYSGTGASPAHYWYIKGSIYVYDQYISSYTGSATAYPESISIPLSIMPGSHGKLTLREVQPNLYAYWDKDDKKLGSADADSTFEVNGKHYALNEPITYWDWNMLTADQQSKFVKMTYTVVEKCQINGVEYNIGDAMLASDVPSSTATAKVWDADTEGYKEVEGKDVSYLIRQTNNVGHHTGYALTYDIDNPMVWNDYYTKVTDMDDKVNTTEYAAGKRMVNGVIQDSQPITKGDYIVGPTYRLTDSKSGVYGQKEYHENDIISKSIVDSYPYAGLSDSELEAKGQAKFEPAWVTTQPIDISGATINAGVAISHAGYASNWGGAIKENVNIAPAKLITSTLKLSDQDYLFAGDVLSEAAIKEKILAANPDWNSLSAAEKEENVNTFYTNHIDYIADAYYCTQDGKYGGKLYETTKAYDALDAWCSMSAEDRTHFAFNFDALDLLIDPNYGGNYGYKPQYDGYHPEATEDEVKAGTASKLDNRYEPLNPPLYSATTPVDYTAKYNGETALEYTDEDDQDISIAPGATITREAYEDIPNEKYHYSPITVTSPGIYYVVNEPFIRGEIPYTAGEMISKAQYEALDPSQAEKVDVLNFPAAKAGTATDNPLVDEYNNPITDDRGYDKVYNSVKYYYCRDSYKVGYNGMGVDVPVETGITSSWTGYPTTAKTYTNTNHDEVPEGIIITEGTYNSLNNLTVGPTTGLGKDLFTIIGTTPTETSTLYVSRESDIYDLSKERVITVIYLYEYEESDETGNNITPVSERHILNIHLQFKSGVPQIGQLTKPNTVLPGSTVGLKTPQVSEGAFEVLTSGWELFASPEDAAEHKNGMPFVNNSTKVYWYQDNYQIAYFAKTYLGKTYSNYVPLTVGNYHDIADVMADVNNHMFIDHDRVKRAPKIYIDNRNTSEKNTDKSELDMLKDLFDLSFHPRYNNDGDLNPAIADGELKDHYGVNTSQIGAAKNLEFFLSDNMAPKKYSPTAEKPSTWTPIGDETKDGTGKFTHCFEGTLHGEGYTISGLDNSLFKSLCGEVYNLGVTGTFTSAGIVDTGTGYIENCWINTTGTPDANVKPLFNTPARTGSTNLVQIVNSYYPEENNYTDHAANAAYGKPIEKPLQSFFNGEVAYDLNGFYLNKRYYDHSNATGHDYEYLDTKDLNAQNKPTVKEGHYPVTDHFDYDYIENRYANVDFTFSGGSIPSSDDVRLVVDTDNNRSYYAPLWPDDYLFFGQRLTYGYVDGRPHQNTPTHITKSSGRLESDGTLSNRVYRAPAYFQSKEMSMAYYNPQALFVDHMNGDVNSPIHRNMTAIDFTGSNGDVAGGYHEGLQSNGHFFPPLLDNDGLTALRNEGLTKNWLVYTPNATDDAQTNSVVLDYLKEYPYIETDPNYRTVGATDENHQTIHGHAVVKLAENNFSAPEDRDHFLVDKQDFNAPIAYIIANGHRMWYQRKPDTYVDRTKGWEGISIPFSAEVVTTQRKGEITHFYSGSRNSYNDTNTKIGHEYWLREFKTGGTTDATDENVFRANFNYPSTQPDWAAGNDKSYTNTFLWDYYYRYSNTGRQDKNTDTFQQDYYKEPKTYEDYAYAAAAKPYIIGFPGTTYYEFDLSGAWKASNSANEINQLAKQIITFASHESTAQTPVTIAVSDDECLAAKVPADGYVFTPNYLSKEVAAGAYVLNSNIYTAVANGTTLTSGKTYYTSDAGAGEFKSNGSEVADGTNYFEMTKGAGSSYDVTAAATAGIPFRPYFTKAPGGVKEYRGVKSIAFNNTRSSLGNDEDQSEPEEAMDGELKITAKHARIIVKSGLSKETTVHIVNAGGAVISVYTIQPGEVVETHVAAGVYLVNQTKIVVK